MAIVVSRIFGSGQTFTNQQTIQGAGNIGVGQTTLVNQGTINATVTGASLIVSPGGGGATNNGGTMQASSGGTLELQNSFDNTNGTIQALNGGTVLLDGASITNGRLMATGTGVISPNGSATLTNLTIAGTGSYLLPNSTTTTLVGTITNNSTINLNAGVNATDLAISGSVTLTGGGTVTMSNSGNSRIFGSGQMFTNQDNLIQGAGNIGVGQTTLVNNGTFLANASNTLFISPGGGGFTNNGTLQVNNGSLMHVVASGPFTNFSGNTLTGGTYDVVGTLASPGTLQIDQLGSTGGEIVNNAATIILDGINSNVVDAAGLDALSSFATNAGSFTIQNGRKFTTPGAFTNLRLLAIGSGSAFSTPNLTNFDSSSGTLTGGTYSVAGTLQFNGANIVTNAATIVLDGSGSQIIDENGMNALASFANNTGSFTIQNGSNLTAGAFTNNGMLTIGTGSTFMTSNLTNFDPGTNTLTGGTYTVIGGTLQFTNANIVNNAATIVVDGSGSRIIDQNGMNALASFANNTGSFTIQNGSNLTTGAFTNNGMLTIGSASTFTTSNLTNFDPPTNTLTGGTYSVIGGGSLQFTNANVVNNAGTILLDGASSQIVDQNGMDAFRNFATNTVTGTFTIQNGRNVTTAGSFTNLGTLTIGANSTLATSSGTFGSGPSSGATTVSGTLSVANGSNFIAGSLTNFDSPSSTLNGGTYLVGGTLQFNNANIVTNAATIVLDGSNSQIIDENNQDGLRNFATNAAAGSFTIQNGRNFTTPGAFTNAGFLAIGSGSTFSTPNLTNFNSSTGTLTGGTYSVAGTLQFNDANIVTNAATIVLNGPTSQIIDQNNLDALRSFANNAAAGSFSLANGRSLTTPGAFTNAGAMTIGAGSTLNISGNYAQTSSGLLLEQLGGTGPGQFGQTLITGSASLSGALNITLVGGFFPSVGDTFMIMTFSSLTGRFDLVNGLDIGGGELLNLEYNPTFITLRALSSGMRSMAGPVTTPEPSTLLLLGSGLVSMLGYCRRQKNRRRNNARR